MNFQDINASASPEVQVNENFQTIEYSSVYGKRQPVTNNLTWGYYGGRWGGITVAAGTISLANNDTNYISVNRSTGVIAAEVGVGSPTTPVNWNNTGSYARVYKVTTASGVVSGEPEDHRAGAYGIHGPTSAGASGSGRHAVPVNAAAMRPSFTGGCASLSNIASAANQPDICTLDFDAITQEYAQFSLFMPKSWNEGTVSFRPTHSHAAIGSPQNAGVVWDLQAVAVSDDETIAQAFGTAQTSTKTGGTANKRYVGPESAAITIAGTPASEDLVFFRISRVTGNASDTMEIDARLHGIVLYITTDAENDA